MITEQTKALAKAKIRQCISAEDIAAELQIPLKLVEEWAGKLTPNDMIVKEATINAIHNLKHYSEIPTSEGVLVPLNEDILKTVLEETAIDITKAMALPALNGDMVHAKAIQLMADAIVKMYHTIILKGGVGTGANSGTVPNSQKLELFEKIMKD